MVEAFIILLIVIIITSNRNTKQNDKRPDI